jgi:hypothetical protein
MLLIATSSLFIVYYLWYLMALLENAPTLFKFTDPIGQGFFIFSQCIHATFVFGGVLGVFSSRFEYASVSLFYWFVSNIYICLLVYMYWPVKTSHRHLVMRLEKIKQQHSAGGAVNLN